MPLISVIVPVYNAEKYLKKCVKSILAQSISDFEVILVDDSSTDGSFKICTDFAREDFRVHALHVPNGGVSQARNEGIKFSTGKYIAFCDSDDYVEPDWLEKMYTLAAGNNSMAICGYRVVDMRTDNNNCGRYVTPTFTYCRKKDFFEVCTQTLFYVVWNKMYSAELIKRYNIRFEKGLSVGEDLLFNLSYLRVCENSLYLAKGWQYSYVLRRGASLDNKYYKDLFQIYVRLYTAIKKCMEDFGADFEQYSGSYYFIYLRMLTAALINNMSGENSMGFFSKIALNTRLMRSKEWDECLKYADLSEYSAFYIKLLRSKQFLPVWLYKQLCPLKGKIKSIIKK